MTGQAIRPVRWIQFWQQEHGGALSEFQANEPAGVPFSIERIFTITGVPSGGSRANHAHRHCTQLLVCVSGRIDVVVHETDGTATSLPLYSDGKALLVPPANWITVKFEDPSTVLMVICDMPYAEDDYIRDWNEYLMVRRGNSPDSPSSIASLAEEQSDAALWQVMAEIYQRIFKAVDEYPPYKIMYPWVARRLNMLAPGASILDIGAGISTMPIYLAEKGHRIDTVDSSKRIRRLPADGSWNGWGFFDYSVVHRNIASYNCDASDFELATLYDAVYSVGMLAFLTSTARRALLGKLPVWLVLGGRLVLALDVVKATDFIWNRCAGQVVEPVEQHGTIHDLDSELRNAGYRIDAFELVRDQPGSRTDLLLVDCVALNRRT